MVDDPSQEAYKVGKAEKHNPFKFRQELVNLLEGAVIDDGLWKLELEHVKGPTRITGLQKSRVCADNSRKNCT